MNGKIMLDTNAVIALFSEEAPIKQVIKSAEIVYLPVQVIGELYYGAYCSSKIEDNRKKIDELLENVEILDCNVETSTYYADTKKKLRIKGTKIPENDIWIAALARQHDLKVISRDKHLKNVKDINLQSW